MFESEIFGNLVSFLVSVLIGVVVTGAYLCLRLYFHVMRTISDKDQSWDVLMGGKNFILVSLAIAVIIWLVWLGIDMEDA